MTNFPIPKITRLLVSPRHFDGETIGFDVELAGERVPVEGRTKGPYETEGTAKAVAAYWKQQLGVDCPIEEGLPKLVIDSSYWTLRLARVNEANARADLRLDP